MMLNIRAGEVPTLIRNTAEEFAGVFYDGGRSDRFRTVGISQKAYVRRYWSNFVPEAVEKLSMLLGMPGLDEKDKAKIAEAIFDFKSRATETTPFPSRRRLN